MHSYSRFVASFSVLCLLGAAGCGGGTTKKSDGSVGKDRSIRFDKGPTPGPDGGTEWDFGTVPDRGEQADLPRKADMVIFPDKSTQPDIGKVPDLSRPDLRTPDRGVARDAPTPDAPVIPDFSLVDGYSGDAPATCGAALGKLCTENGGECGPAAFCLMTSQTGGICTCPCDPANPAQGCPDPSKHACGAVPLSDGSVYNLCFVGCQPKLGANDCTAPLACEPGSARYSGAMDKAVCLFAGCTDNAECPMITGTACTVGATTTGCAAGEECLGLTATGTAGVCAKPGVCDKASGLCGLKTGTSTTAKIGDPCKGDQDCGAAMGCSIEFDPAALGYKDHGAACTGDDCCGYCNPQTQKCEGSCAVHARNGYCVSRGCVFATATHYKEFACAAGAVCNRLYVGGMCMKECALNDAASCRGHAADAFADYECRSWDRITDMGGTAFASKPVCDFGDTLPCDFFGSSYTCADVGDATNSTNMRCRLLNGSDAATPTDVAGFCLDDTSSGGAASSLLKYGDVCDPAAPKCEPGLTCLPYGATKGYCTASCTTAGAQCPNTPTGTVAACLVEWQGTDYCMFLCKVGTSTWSCPSTTTCDATENPAGSGQFLCVAP